MAGDDQSVVERIHQMVLPFDCSLHPDWLWTWPLAARWATWLRDEEATC
jgi:hypothetical protein